MNILLQCCLVYAAVFMVGITGKPIILDTNQNIIDQLRHAGINLISPRLHLGCGQTYFSGYINIDYPSSEHTIQKQTRADVLCNICSLKFPNTSIHEIRSHHVFEHFDRSTALALLCAWNAWLVPNGILTIETPDFKKSIEMLTSSSYNYTQKQAIMRHVFGSHEAHWAIHYDGWYQEKFEHILHALGFEIITTKTEMWQLTANITITAKKIKTLTKQEAADEVFDLLAEYLIDTSSSELMLLEQWHQAFKKVYLSMAS